MKYTEETIKTDFSYRARDHYNQGLIELLNLYYDRIKNMPIDEVKKLLPIDHHGYNGTYLEDWMIREAPHTTKRFPFSIIGDIWSWYGDKTTSSVVLQVQDMKSNQPSTYFLCVRELTVDLDAIPNLSTTALSSLSGSDISVSSTEASSISKGQWYVMKNRGRNGYAFEDNGSMKNRAAAPSGSATENAKFLVRFVNAGDDKYYLQNGSW